jgi:hypothetical protein
VQSVDEIFLAGLLGLSMDGPAAYLCGVMRPVAARRQYALQSNIKSKSDDSSCAMRGITTRAVIAGSGVTREVAC